MGRAAERPPLARFWHRPRLRGLAVAALGAALEAGVSLVFGPAGLDDLHLAVALGILTASLAGALGGPWVGAGVAAIGWVLQFVAADETVRDLSTLPVWIAAGALAGWLVLRLGARSTEREALRDRLDAVRDSTHDAIVEIDGDGLIVAWNSGAEEIYGCAHDEAIGQGFAEMVAADDDETTMRLLEAVVAGERVSEPSIRHRRKDGTARIVSATAIPLAVTSGSGGTALILVRDVTDLLAARDEVEELQGRYRSLTGQLPGATYIHPIDGRNTVQYVSPQLGTMLGYRTEDWLAKPGLFFHLLHDDDRERVQEEIVRASESSAPFRSEYRLLTRAGRVVWVRDEAATVRASDGTPLYVQGYLVDVGAERETRAEREQLRAAERAAVAESTQRQLSIDLISRASVVLGASFEPETALRRLAEIAVEGLADWCIVDLVDEHGDARRAAVARGDVEPLDGAPAAAPDSDVVEVMESGEPSLSAEQISVPVVARGRTVGAITLIASEAGRAYGPDDLGVAEHLARVAALAIDNARLYQQVQEGADAAHVLTYVADGVFLVDRAGVIRLWNPTVEAITGLEARAVVGRQAADVIPEWQTLAQCIPVGGAEPVQPETVPMETEHGERWISVSGVEFFGGIVYALRDLTDVRRLEQLKAEFVATASHELRTPLAAVYGAAQTLRRHDFALDEAGRERFVSLIVDESERLGRIVNDILLANQLDVGNLDLRTDLFDPSELVDRVVEAARVHAPAAIELETAADSTLPAVASDRDRVRQVLVNLVENAIKYSPEGGRVEVGAAQAGKMIRFYVRDQGLGVPADEQSRIFDKFYRLDPQMTGGIGGTGLGLYICSELIQRLGGHIWVESEGEIGSTFLFEIPANESFASRPLALESPDVST